MKLSIFEGVKPFPKSQKEKQKESFKIGGWTDKQTGEIHEPILPTASDITTEDDIIELITNFAWSPFIFNGPKLQENFVSTDFAVLDIDSGLTIQEAEKRVEEANIMCLCVPTTSHTPELHKFRLIFPLAYTIKNRADYVATMEDLFEAFPEADRSCVTDNARFYFGSSTVDGFWYEGEFLVPIKYVKKSVISNRKRVRVDESVADYVTTLYGQDRGSIPETVDYFIKNAHTGLVGEWTTSLNSFVFTLALQGLEKDDIIHCVEDLAPDALDKKDLRTIEYAFRDGSKAHEADDYVR